MTAAALRLLALAAALALAGCSAPTAHDLSCPGMGTWGRIVTHENGTLEVVLMDFSPAVLHIGGAEVYVLVSGEDCYEAEQRHLEPGKEIAFDPGAWAESHPPQAWPEAIVILG